MENMNITETVGMVPVVIGITDVIDMIEMEMEIVIDMAVVDI